MARPKAEDPKVQRNIYPPTSLWDRVSALAEKQGKRVGELFVTLAAEGLEAREAGGADAADR